MTMLITAAAALLSALPAATLAADEPQKVFDDLFGAEVRRVSGTTDTKDDVALATLLLNAAKTARSDPALYALVLQNAATLAGRDPDGADTAIAALRLSMPALPAGKRIEALEKVVTVRQRQFRAVAASQRAVVGQALAQELLELADVHAWMRRDADMNRTLQQAQQIAAASQSPIRGIVQARKEHMLLDQQFEHRDARLRQMVDDLTVRVTANPADTEARQALGSLLLTDGDDPIAAAKYLSADEAQTPRRNLMIAGGAARPANDEGWFDLAQWYYQLAQRTESGEGRANALARALRYYRLFLLVHTSADLRQATAKVMADKLEPMVQQVGLVGADGQWSDVLALADPEKDDIFGQWQRRGAALVSPPGLTSRILLPVAVEGDYELDVQFDRPADHTVAALFLPLGKAGAWLMFGGGDDGKQHSLSLVNGSTLVSQPADLAPGRTHRAAVTVKWQNELATVSVQLNGSAILQWQGKPAVLSLPMGWWMPHGRAPGFGATRAGVRFTAARVRLTNGKARLLRQGVAPRLALDPRSGVDRPDTNDKKDDWIDVKRDIKPAMDTFRGVWEQTKDGLLAQSRDKARITVPFAPKGDYEFETTFTCATHCEGIALILPVGSEAAMFTLNGWLGYISGLEAINGQRAKDNATKLRTQPLEKNRKYTLLASVHRQGDEVSIQIKLDGKDYLKWQGPVASLSLPEEYFMPYKGMLGLGAHQTKATFHTVRLKMLNGDVKSLRVNRPGQ